MTKRVIYHALLVADLTEAIDWYDEKAISIGDRFRAAVDRAFQEIEHSPAPTCDFVASNVSRT